MLAFALVRFSPAPGVDATVRRGAACIGCKLVASVRCFPSLSCSHALPSVDSQAVLSVRWRQYKLAASADSAIGLNVLGVYHS